MGLSFRTPHAYIVILSESSSENDDNVGNSLRLVVMNQMLIVICNNF